MLVVTQNLLQNHPDIVSDLLKGLVKSVNWINANESAAPAAVNAALASTTGGKPLKSSRPDARVDAPQLPARPVRGRSADGREQRPEARVQQDAASVKGILDLGPLNAILTAAGDPTVSAGALG